MAKIFKRNRDRLALLILFAIFMGPILVSWALLMGPKDFHPETTSNRGVLIEPVKHISATNTNIRSPSIEDDYFQGLWTLLYVRVQSDPRRQESNRD